MPDEHTLSTLLLKKEGTKLSLTPRGEAMIRLGFGTKVPADAVIKVESTTDGIRVTATFSEEESAA